MPANRYAEFKSELLSFPAGKYDDQVDGLGLIGQLLDQMVPGQASKPPEPRKIDTGYRLTVLRMPETTGVFLGGVLAVSL